MNGGRLNFALVFIVGGLVGAAAALMFSVYFNESKDTGEQFLAFESRVLAAASSGSEPYDGAQVFHSRRIDPSGATVREIWVDLNRGVGKVTSGGTTSLLRNDSGLSPVSDQFLAFVFGSPPERTLAIGEEATTFDLAPDEEPRAVIHVAIGGDSTCDGKYIYTFTREYLPARQEFQCAGPPIINATYENEFLKRSELPSDFFEKTE